MYQLINMYQPVFRRQPKILSAATLMTIVAIVIALMSAIYLNAHATMKGMQRTSANLDLNYTQLEPRIGAATSIAASSRRESVSDSIAALQTQISDSSELLNRIDDLFIDADIGFGDVFETLARTKLPGLWLTGVQLGQDGSIEISGTALDPELVPGYLRLLTQQSPLKTLNNGTVSLVREDPDQSEIKFVLNYDTRGEEQ